MKKTIYAVLFLFLFALPVSAVEEERTIFHGSISAGYRVVDENSDNKARFLEYYNLDDDAVGALALSLQRGAWYVDLEALDIGLDDQAYRLGLTNYGNFEAAFFYKEFTHSLSLDAFAPYTGVGGSDLQLLTTGSPADFDYEVERKEFGGEATFSFGTPFYLSLGLQRRQEDGLKPLGSGSYWFNLELPEPVDYTTDDLSLVIGYRGATIQAAIKGYWSEFDNADEYLTRPLDGAVVTLPPDNDYGKIAADMSWRGLPLDSMLAARFSYARLESNLSLRDLGLAASPELYRTSFDGDITYTKASVALTSRPLKNFDTRIYFSFLDKDNDSTPISSAHAESIFDFKEKIAGFDLGWQPFKHTSFTTGYEYRDVDRNNQLDAKQSRDHTVFIELKNQSLDFLVAKLRYKHLERDSDFTLSNSGADPVTDGEEWIKRYIRRFDVTDKSMDEIRLALEFYPRENFDLGLTYTYLFNDYDETEIGLTEDLRHEVYTDFVWRAAAAIRVSGFAGYEMTSADSRQRQFGVGESADIDAPTGSAFNWKQESKADFWTCGLSLDWKNMIDKLSLNLSWQYQNSDGEINFSSPAGDLTDISHSDDYDLQKLQLKLSYALRSNTEVTLGYMFEKYDGDDLQFADYEAFRADGEVFGSYLTGAYFDDDYRANIAYLMLSYNF